MGIGFDLQLPERITFNHFVSPFRFCRCGLPRDRHKLQGTVIITDPSVTWVSEQCTRRIPTDTFGEIEFAEDPSSRKPVSSKFLLLYLAFHHFSSLEVWWSPGAAQCKKLNFQENESREKGIHCILNLYKTKL